jgi:hypothetical protein
MHKPHPGVQLRIAGEPFLKARHTDQDDADIPMVIQQTAS